MELSLSIIIYIFYHFPLSGNYIVSFFIQLEYILNNFFKIPPSGIFIIYIIFYQAEELIFFRVCYRFPPGGNYNVMFSFKSIFLKILFYISTEWKYLLTYMIIYISAKIPPSGKLNCIYNLNVCFECETLSLILYSFFL